MHQKLIYKKQIQRTAKKINIFTKEIKKLQGLTGFEYMHEHMYKIHSFVKIFFSVACTYVL
jgi:hypothetical protein